MTRKKLRTHYDNLKVARDAPPEVIKGAYRALSQRYHPDRNPGSERAARIMAIVNVSYAVLSDPVTRKAHDEWIALQESHEHDVFGQSEAEPIRAEKRQVEQPPPETTPFNWTLERIGRYALALIVPLLIIGLLRLPSAISKVSRANSSPAPHTRSERACDEADSDD